MPDTYEIKHLPMREGRAALSKMNFAEYGIPSISPLLDGRYKAEFKGRFLNPGENAEFLDEALETIRGLQNVTTQRDIYYALRGAHPEWTYKDQPLGQEFYEHLTQWIMEKAQLMTGMTMQSMGVWAGPRGYVVGDGVVITKGRGKVPLASKPALDFDMAENIQVHSNAMKVIHFEKDAGLTVLTSGDFPKYVEAVFSTSQGVSSEAAMKFLRLMEEEGYDLYSINDADPAGIQMALQFGMGSKNNCYMPAEFYPKLVKPLGLFPSIALALGLPPESVPESKDKIFNNITTLAAEKQRVFPVLRKYRLPEEAKIIIENRQMWEFQALSAESEVAPQIYTIEALRMSNDSIKYVHDGDDIRNVAISAARAAANVEVESSISALADAMYTKHLKPELIKQIKTQLGTSLKDFNDQVIAADAVLRATPAENYRETIKAQILADPSKYSADLVKGLGRRLLTAHFTPLADLSYSLEVSDVRYQSTVTPHPPAPRIPLTKTQLVDAIEARIITNSAKRRPLVQRIRTAFQERFGAPKEEW